MQAVAHTPHADRSVHRSRISRRQLVARLAAAGASAPVIAAVLASEGVPGTAAQPVASPEAIPGAAEALTALGKDPRLIPYSTTNFGTPLELVDGLLTPNELFFVRSNGPTPAIDPATWRLAVTGLVDTPLDLGLADLQAMATSTLTAFLECSGDSRGRFDPQTEGTQWGNTAIGNAEWTGIPLRDVLENAGVQAGVVDLVTQGGDFPEMQRGLPLGHALDPSVMLVWEMNGQPLPVANGGPVRLLVPAWGGIASTKWIVGIEAMDRKFNGPFNSESYVIINEAEEIIRPVEEMPVKSVITGPLPGATLPAGSQTITGFAWSGYGGVARVEVSIDGGATYAEAPITLSAGPYSWVRFEFPWQAAAGTIRLRSRAVDNAGLTQPTDVDWNAKGYQMNEIDEVEVTVQ